MAGPPRAVAVLRTAVRPGLRASDRPVLAACSGGADSVALAAALAFEARHAGVRAGGITVDHGLQPGSAERAERTAQLLRGLGLDPVLVRRVAVAAGGGPEGAARTARYEALAAAAAQLGARVALGHTLDDQAETVLLGLGRGSGPRSVAGMVPERTADGTTWWRPLLGVRRATTREACADQGLPVWDDPWNADPAYTRARLRGEVLPLLEDVLGGGVAPALARTADLLREDLDALDELAAAELARLAGADELAARELGALPAALRRRVLRGWLRAAGVPDVQAVHLRAVEALVTGWRGQGRVDLPGGAGALRTSGRLVVSPPETRGPRPEDAPPTREESRP
ncbi:tRNA lysidine(34) synthetase TilS [Geodermatophilus obscurus]|uniref:tRNA(Ile)-lysidine synthase n=1 Tax=Geodermatophilus obscurus (strain ATCC 25078 / DSM 43160 / JCM 3152 / CCUG 61914 / KCC A-0152 / KCTC 9177 / NBRC 13315 / NRRL B-3577 / G-20) TaxID=526225 RepID=D2S794_GEOOG|nr:tRNA lysidine(34) synthetase TilS [Geodermatophilus obscurus]ADB73394.1 tRNA(Ile)-lysidine synthetase [Geodermatophilus obscurus DSM 43160]